MGLSSSAKWDSLGGAVPVNQALLLRFRQRVYVHTAAARAIRRERRGGDADAEAPQAFKEGASTLRNAQNRTGLILAVLRRRGGLWGGVRLSMVGVKEEGGHPVEGSPLSMLRFSL